MTLDELDKLAKRVAERQQMVDARQKLLQAGTRFVSVVEEAGDPRLGARLLFSIPAYAVRKSVDEAIATIEDELTKAGLAFEPTIKTDARRT